MKVRIPREIYLSRIPQNNGLPLGNIVPVGDAEFERNKLKLNSWSNRPVFKHIFSHAIIKNELLCGFCLSEASYWRLSISDPRGFDVELRPAHLVYLMSRTTAIRGEISERCVWAFSDTGEVLLCPEDSQEHVECLIEINCRPEGR